MIKFHIHFLNIFLLPILLSITSCTPKQQPEAVFKESRFVMGTIVGISVVAADKDRADAAIKAAYAELERLEKMMSVQMPSSVVSEINRSAGIKPVKVPPEVLEVLVKAQEIYRQSKGLFAVTVGPLVNLWGVEVKGHYVPSSSELSSVLALCNFDDLEIDSGRETVFLKKTGMAIDLGGIAKGYAADRAIDVLKTNGVSRAIVAVAGDIRALGSRPDGTPWRIGVQHPRKNDALLTTLDLSDRAVSTAGDYERFFIKDNIRYHHILNPKTGLPASECRSATVIAPRGLIADPLSTTLFLLGPADGMALIESMNDIDAIIVDKNGQVTVSSRLKNKVNIQ